MNAASPLSFAVHVCFTSTFFWPASLTASDLSFGSNSPPSDKLAVWSDGTVRLPRSSGELYTISVDFGDCPVHSAESANGRQDRRLCLAIHFVILMITSSNQKI